MKLAVLAVLPLVALAGCATKTTVTTLAPGKYLVCDKSSGSACDGANPEKGLSKACLPQGRSILSYHEEKHVGQGVVVVCGPPGSAPRH